jgi:nitronate monooxygenase
MYPCSNPELVAAVSECGGMGIVQPLSLTYVWEHSFKDGIKHIKALTKKPIGMNVLLEKASRTYEKRMMEWVDIALEEGIRFFVTALGNPKEIAKKVHTSGGKIYHDVTEKKWAEKALESNVDGLICVNNRAGGHAGHISLEKLYLDLKDFNVPLVCAGGIGDELDYIRALKTGYQGVQLGTRFIATFECKSPEDYKDAIVRAEEKNIVLTEKVTGIPLSVIRTPYVEKIGTKASPIAKFLLKKRKAKEWVRLYYNLISIWKFKRSMKKGFSTKDYWQAGKSVEHIKKVESVKDIMARFEKETREFLGSDVTATSL